MAQKVKNLTAVKETKEIQVQSLSREGPLEEETAAHSSILTWEIPWTEDPGRPQSTGLQSGTQLSNYTPRGLNVNSAIIFLGGYVKVWGRKEAKKAEKKEALK